jgi:hypothetical protein
MGEFLEKPTSWIITLVPLGSNVVISEVDAVVYVVLNKAEKHKQTNEHTLKSYNVPYLCMKGILKVM